MDLKILEIASNTENHKVVKNHTHLSKKLSTEENKYLIWSILLFLILLESILTEA